MYEPALIEISRRRKAQGEFWAAIGAAQDFIDSLEFGPKSRTGDALSLYEKSLVAERNGDLDDALALLGGSALAGRHEAQYDVASMIIDFWSSSPDADDK